QGGKIAGIGTYRGRSLMSIAEILREKQIKVIAVDTFFTAYKQDLARDRYKCFSEKCATFGIFDLVTIFNSTSVNAAKQVADSSLDFVFIDGDHLAVAVAADIAAWRPKIKPDGWIGGHDFNYESVQKSVRKVYRATYRYEGSAIWLAKAHEWSYVE